MGQRTAGRFRALKALAAGAAIVLAAGGVTACGASRGTTSTGSGGDDGAYKLYLQYNQGEVTDQPDGKYGAEAAVAAINKAGGVDGHKLELETCNDHGVPADQTACIRRALSSGAVASVGLSGTGLSAQLKPVVDAKLPLIGYLANPLEFNVPTAYPLGSYTGGMYMSLPFAMKERQHVRRIAVLARDDASSQPSIPLIREGAKKAGVEYAGTVIVPGAGAPDYAPYAQKIQQLRPDGVIFDTNVTIGGSMMRALDAIGAHPSYGFTLLSVALRRAPRR